MWVPTTTFTDGDPSLLTAVDLTAVVRTLVFLTRTLDQGGGGIVRRVLVRGPVCGVRKIVRVVCVVFGSRQILPKLGDQCVDCATIEGEFAKGLEHDPLMDGRLDRVSEGGREMLSAE